MTLENFVNNSVKRIQQNSPEILTGLAIGGVMTTAYLAGKAGFQAGQAVEYHESIAGTPEDRKERFKSRAKETWRFYIPAGVSGVLTVGAMLGSAHASGRRTAAAVTAYSVTERAFTEYKERVVEEVGKGKEQKIRDKLAEEKVAENPPNTNQVLITGKGEVLCCELFTRRYFKSDMETLRKAQNDINMLVMNELYVTMDEFYGLIGLDGTTNSDKLGWDSDRLMELQFSTVLTDGGEPCLAFEYNYTKPLE